jgi:hypothetical protein
MSMPIFPDAITPDPLPMQVVEALQRINAAILNQLLDNYRLLYVRTWFNQQATPAEIFADLDANGEALLDSLQARVDCITALAALKGETFDDQFIDGGPLAAPPAYSVSGGVVTITP